MFKDSHIDTLKKVKGYNIDTFEQVEIQIPSTEKCCNRHCDKSATFVVTSSDSYIHGEDYEPEFYFCDEHYNTPEEVLKMREELGLTPERIKEINEDIADMNHSDEILDIIKK